ncbi:glycosyltransferase family 2 protein [Flavihumibacter sp. CACIAM 22H1]|uniref:glycosyltransferase family 2 protein n=1 Tax=Flavihumibacter sp. CACIAM 22H1 TaxID=1812911 RepID=UPI0007A80AC4|nr:glycosyltransferase family 2 protein [Flavihumibacter sp. CACIAM 22H1]KYP15181.1 MAG: glycosyl transferase family 2 [Flavihumibacter sp. CACIAM 22H1]
MQPLVSVVILNWNGRKHLENFLPSVQEHACAGMELVVADNASTDDSVHWLETNYPNVRVIRLEKNFGFAKGYNEALKQVDARYYVLLNSDVEVTANWLQPIISLMEANPGIGAAQPKIKMYHNKELFEYAGAAGGWLDSLGYPFARGRVFDFCEEDQGQYDDTADVFWASGAALVVQAGLYHRLGGLDEFFFAHQEEIDFCWRMQLAGYRVVVCPGSEVYHVGGGTLPKGNEWKVFLNFRNNLIMLAKNLPWYALIWKIPFRFLLDAVSAWKSLFEGQAIYFKAILEAHIGFMGWVLLRHRRSVFPISRKGSLRGWYKGSVVWAHFIRGRRYFSEIVGRKA